MSVYLITIDVSGSNRVRNIIPHLEVTVTAADADEHEDAGGSGDNDDDAAAGAGAGAAAGDDNDYVIVTLFGTDVIFILV